MLSTSRPVVAGDLFCFHEPATAEWVLESSDDDFVRVCDVADFLLYEGPAQASGASMMIAKACALAAIYVREGAPRNLARNRRDLGLLPTNADSDASRMDDRLQTARPSWFAVGDDAIAFWASDPERARSLRARFADLHRDRFAPPA